MIIFPKRSSAGVPNAPANKLTLFIDAATGMPMVKDEFGNTASLQGPEGPAGAGGISGPVNVIAVGADGQEVALSTENGGVDYIALFGNNPSFVTPSPAPGVITESLVIIENGGSYDIDFPESWAWADGSPAVVRYMWSRIYIRLLVLGTGADPTVQASYQSNAPAYHAPLAAWNTEYSLDDGVLTLDLGTGNFWWIELDQNVDKIKITGYTNALDSGGNPMGSFPAEIKVLFQQGSAPNPSNFTVAFPDGVWKGGAKPVMPTGDGALLMVSMVIEGDDGSMNPENEYTYVDYGYADECADISDAP